MAVSLRATAARAPVPVLVAQGVGARLAAARLVADPRVELVDSPRHATVLLVLGALPESLLPALYQVHDQVPAPRATVWWTGDATALSPLTPTLEPRRIGPHDDPVAVLTDLHADVLAGTVDEPDLLPAENPVRWQGVGPHGQGGRGMMGGTPYGRAMAMTADDLRDGLALDRVPLRAGPFLPGFPPGLVLDTALQGDVLQSAALDVRPADTGERFAGAPIDGPSSAVAALTAPASIADLERERARSHLAWAAEHLRLQGLDALARRTARLAAAEGASAEDVRRLHRRLRRLRAVDGATRDVGILPAEAVEELGGPVARAAGRMVDLRHEDPAYRRLGFVPVTGEAGDARARFHLRFEEAAAALDLAARAGEAVTTVTGAVEGPQGPVSTHGSEVPRLRERVADLLVGRTWSEAVTTLHSLDLLPDATVAAPLPKVPA